MLHGLGVLLGEAGPLCSEEAGRGLLAVELDADQAALEGLAVEAPVDAVDLEPASGQDVDQEKAGERGRSSDVGRAEVGSDLLTRLLLVAAANYDDVEEAVEGEHGCRVRVWAWPLKEPV